MAKTIPTIEQLTENSYKGLVVFEDSDTHLYGIKSFLGSTIYPFVFDNIAIYEMHRDKSVFFEFCYKNKKAILNYSTLYEKIPIDERDLSVYLSNINSNNRNGYHVNIIDSTGYLFEEIFDNCEHKNVRDNVKYGNKIHNGDIISIPDKFMFIEKSIYIKKQKTTAQEMYWRRWATYKSELSIEDIHSLNDYKKPEVEFEECEIKDTFINVNVENKTGKKFIALLPIKWFFSYVDGSNYKYLELKEGILKEENDEWWGDRYFPQSNVSSFLRKNYFVGKTLHESFYLMRGKQFVYQGLILKKRWDDKFQIIPTFNFI